MTASKTKYFNYSDIELQCLVSEGSEMAFKEIFERKQAFIYNYALKLTRVENIAEEIVQEIFIKIWKSRKLVKDIDNLDAYLNRATRNQCYSALRKIAADALRLVSIKDSESSAIEAVGAESLTLYNESLKLLKTVVDNLPPQRKRIYQLCHEEGYTYDEVAKQLHISSGTVHTHMKLALKTIRAYFRDMDKIIALLILFHL